MHIIITLHLIIIIVNNLLLVHVMTLSATQCSTNIKLQNNDSSQKLFTSTSHLKVRARPPPQEFQHCIYKKTGIEAVT